jgi:predicted CoA-binding protein
MQINIRTSEANYGLDELNSKHIVNRCIEFEEDIV